MKWKVAEPLRTSRKCNRWAFFDEGGFKALLSDLVAIPSTAQEEGREADLDRYLDGAIRPWLERLGFAVPVRPNPLPGFGPILTATRIEDPSRPTVLLYGHGDTVRGLDDQWRPGLEALAS
jgi:acetylornithine deacetylase/succinyl-diaminopimelate desuccinylase-like protein